MNKLSALNFPKSNNEVEYEAILVGLNLTLILSTRKVEVKSDLQLVVGQIQREYEAKDKCMARYLALADTWIEKLDRWSIKFVPQEENGRADALTRVTIALPLQETMMLPVYLHTTPSISLERVHDID